MKRLILNKLRKKHKHTWNTIANAIGVSVSTLQDIDKRERERDIFQVGARAKQTLEKLAHFWDMEYEDLFESIDDSGIHNELDDLDEIVEYTERVQSDGISSNAFDDFVDLINNTPFIFNGDYTKLVNEFLMAEVSELNILKEDVIYRFIALCQEYDDIKVIKNIAEKLLYLSSGLSIKVMIYFAGSMLRCEFIEWADKLFIEAGKKFKKLI